MSGATAAKSDTDILYEILNHFGWIQDGWVSHERILTYTYDHYGHGLTVHSRASDLRKRGFTVECKVERHNGRVKSYYRLVTS